MGTPADAPVDAAIAETIGDMIFGSAAADTAGVAEAVGAGVGASAAEGEGAAAIGAAGSGAAGTAEASGTVVAGGGAAFPAASAGTSGVIDSLKTAATVLSPVASLISASSGISASRRLAGAARGGADGTGSGATQTTVFPPATMPVFGGQQSLGVQRAALTEQIRRRGRASTVLTSDAPGGESLGS